MVLKEQIGNMIRSQRLWSISKSFHHYHVKNLSMVRVSDKILLYIAGFDHLLHTNSEATGFNNQSVGFHSHQCDVTFTLIHAESPNKSIKPYLINMRADLQPDVKGMPQYLPKFGVYKHRRKSQIKAGEGNFYHIGITDLYLSLGIKTLMLGEPVHTKANELHTVYGTKDCKFAFLAEKGDDNPAFESLHYSTSDLTKFSDVDLYKPMSENDHRTILSSIGITV